MFRLLNTLVCSLFCLLLLANHASAKTLEAINACITANLPQNSSVQRLEVRSIDRSQRERNITIKVYWKRFSKTDIRTSLHILAPEDLAGARYLVTSKQDDQAAYMYLPALNKVRRITGQAKSSPLWGTDLSYADIKYLYGLVAASTKKQLPDSVLFDRPAHVIEFITKPEENPVYQKVVSYIDQKTCALLKAELFETAATPRKIITIAPNSLKQHGTRWLPHKLILQDLRDNTKTVLRLLEVEFEPKLRQHLFSPAHFSR